MLQQTDDPSAPVYMESKPQVLHSTEDFLTLPIPALHWRTSHHPDYCADTAEPGAPVQLSLTGLVVQANSVPRPKISPKFSINNLISISEYASQGNVLSESYSALI